jgi:hypothetical protein
VDLPRFDPVIDRSANMPDGNKPGMVPAEFGEWVRYRDAVALAPAPDEVVVSRATAEAALARLAADLENAEAAGTPGHGAVMRLIDPVSDLRAALKEQEGKA